MGIRFRYRSVAAAESGEGSRPPLGYRSEVKRQKNKKKKEEKEKTKNIAENRKNDKDDDT